MLDMQQLVTMTPPSRQLNLDSSSPRPKFSPPIEPQAALQQGGSSASDRETPTLNLSTSTFSYRNPFDVVSMLEQDEQATQDNERTGLERDSYDSNRTESKLSSLLDAIHKDSSYRPDRVHDETNASPALTSPESSVSLLDTLMKDASPFLSVRPLSPDKFGPRRTSLTSQSAVNHSAEIDAAVADQNEAADALQPEVSPSTVVLPIFPTFLPDPITNAVQTWTSISANDDAPFEHQQAPYGGRVFSSASQTLSSGQKTMTSLDLSDRVATDISQRPLAVSPITIIATEASFLDGAGKAKWGARLICASDDLYAYAMKGMRNHFLFSFCTQKRNRHYRNANAVCMCYAV